jgi:hypothetical protein
MGIALGALGLALAVVGSFLLPLAILWIGLGVAFAIAGGWIALSAPEDEESFSPLDSLVAIESELDRAASGSDDADRILDQILEESAPAFLELREPLVERIGLGAYAEMIGHFAGMERHAGRAWTAIVENRPDDLPAALEAAKGEISRARGVLERALAVGPPRTLHEDSAH